MIEIVKFLSTLSLRRATEYCAKTKHTRNISIHALLAESDLLQKPIAKTGLTFLSTLSLRRATQSARRQLPERVISIHALLAESDERAHNYPQIAGYISIHALLAESDDNGYDGLSQVTVFLSTLSLRRATPNHDPYEGVGSIFLSTLSLRRATASMPLYMAIQDNFYPRSPCGERRVKTQGTFNTSTFLSTLSLRRATRREPRESI